MYNNNNNNNTTRAIYRYLWPIIYIIYTHACVQIRRQRMQAHGRSMKGRRVNLRVRYREVLSSRAARECVCQRVRLCSGPYLHRVMPRRVLYR